MIYDPDRNVFHPSETGCLLPHVMWHISDVCPLRCPYCFSRKTDQETPKDRIAQTVAVFSALGVQKVDIGGGEPLVYEHLQYAVSALRAADIFCTITTSGVGRKSNVDFLESEAAHFTRVIVSLDAHGARHDSLRRFDGAWRAAESLLNAMDSETRRARARVNTVVTASAEFNATLEALAAFVVEHEVREWCLIQPHPANQKPGFKDFAVDEHGFDNVCATAAQLMRGPTALIKRKISLYSDYWVLHPNGMLQKHSSGSVDCAGVNIHETGTSELASLIERLHASAPLE